jgi:hypothetical protein
LEEVDGQEHDDKKENPGEVHKPKEEMDQTDRAHAVMAERLAKEGPKVYPPDFVDYGEANQRIDRDEVWVH